MSLAKMGEAVSFYCVFFDTCVWHMYVYFIQIHTHTHTYVLLDYAVLSIHAFLIYRGRVENFLRTS